MNVIEKRRSKSNEQQELCFTLRFKQIFIAEHRDKFDGIIIIIMNVYVYNINSLYSEHKYSGMLSLSILFHCICRIWNAFEMLQQQIKLEFKYTLLCVRKHIEKLHWILLVNMNTRQQSRIEHVPWHKK